MDNTENDKGFVFVSEDPIDVNSLSHSLQQSSAGIAGGHVFFIGTVRGGEVQSMTVEHYPRMTEKSLSTIAQTAKQRWSLLGVTIAHRVGRLLSGDVIVFAGCSAPHRKDAFTACEYIVDRLKTDAPFWKKEEVAGTHRWVNANAADTQATHLWTSEK